MKAQFVAILIAFITAALLLALLGESPAVLWEALSQTLFTSFGLGYTLFYATPLIFTGLSVALAFHSGLLNIGGEGQLYLGAVSVIAVSTLLPTAPACVAIPVGILAAILGGALWGGIAGFLKGARGSHEVIVTILLNFIGLSLVDYLILYPLRNPEVQNPESLPIPSAFEIPKLSEVTGLFATTPVNLALCLALIAALFCHWLLYRTTIGFELRAVGLNPVAARFQGISVRKNMLLAMSLAGGLAGMVGVNEILGHQHRLIEGFSPQYGFTGIAVALLARNHPLGILLSALLFGALHNAARELEFSSDKVTKELSLVIQGIIVALIAAEGLIQRGLERLRRVSP